MNTFKKIISNPITLAIGLIVLSQIAAIGFRHSAKSTGMKLIAPLDRVSIIQSDLKGSDYSLNSEELIKVQKLNRIILEHKEHHRRTFLTLYQFHFSSITQLTIFSVITGLLAFLIGQKGWRETDQWIRSLFLTSGALTSFYVLSINVFKQDVGINKNLESYIQYDNLQKEVLNFCSTEPHQSIKGDTLNFTSFHTYAVTRLVEINNIYLEFDKDALEGKNYLDRMYK